MTTVNVSSASVRKSASDVVVIGLTKGESGPQLADGSDAVADGYPGSLLDDLVTVGATGKASEVTRLPSRGATTAPLLLAVGLGSDPDHETLRQAAGAAARAAAGNSRLSLSLPGSSATEIAAIAQGALLGAYSYGEYRAADPSTRPVQRIVVHTPDARSKVVRQATADAGIVADGVHFVRDLVNTPPRDLPPQELAAIASSRARALGLTVKVWDDAQLRRHGFGGLTGVGQGSTRGPRLVRIGYRGRGAKSHVALVGKGITFDSGGLSLKPPKSMETMKCDMGGAAAVLGTMLSIAQLKPSIEVTGWMCLAENLPSGSAQRPGDIITIYGGRRVEVLNTDAEGRLVLADGLVRAQEDGPQVVIDIATLTGAQTVALGSRTSGIMSNDDDLRSFVFDASQRAGEAMWPMPLPPHLRSGLDSPVADIANIGGAGNGGMLVAGLFLQEFIRPGVRWAHLDIAGPAFNEHEPHGYTPRMGTGAGVRTLVQVLGELAAGPPLSSTS